MNLARRRLTQFLLLSPVLANCSTPARIDAVPQQLTQHAVIPGIPNARYWADGDSGPFVGEATEVIRREQNYLGLKTVAGARPRANFLAISGGGDNGAFGAGLLNGWSETGRRPAFIAVTGVSTGALIAPFAFLGPQYDQALKTIYTTVSSNDIFRKRSLLAALFNDAMADLVPMLKLVDRYVTPAMLAQIAEEYAKGRLLLIGTTNLDARRPVIWNMTAIAASQSPNAPELFRQVLVASAAMPAAFPPVMIEVEVDGRRYQEMHVDGGAIAQVFLYPPSVQLGASATALGIKRQRSLYIIRNARLDPDWANVERKTMRIATRAISSLVSSEGIGDLYRIYLAAMRDGIDFNLAFIPAEFDAPHPGEFDTGYMNSLFDLGQRLARKGYDWHKYPPGFAVRKPTS